MAVSQEFMAEMADAAKSVVADSAEEEASIEELGSHPNLQETIDVDDSGFWDNEDEAPEGESDETPSDEDDVSEGDGQGTIKYLADGEEVEISLEEAKKKLSLVDGARKAFSDRTKLRKQVAKLKKDAEEGREYKETWEKLESVKHDKRKLYELITGESYDDFVAREVERQELYQSASPEERRAMDSEARLRQLEQEMEVGRKQRERERTEAEKKEFNAEKTLVQGQLEREFFKHDFQVDNPQVANKLKTMLWRNAVADLKDYYQEYGKMTPKMIAKAFADNAAALNHYFKSSSAQEAKKSTAEKKTVAKEKAKEAATKNYSGTVKSDLLKLDPLKLFQKAKKQGRF